jgi:drug/metabolite transporter (DMT)-like permease
MSSPIGNLRLKTWVVAVVVVLANLAGNSCLSWGLKQRGRALGVSPFEYVAAVFTPWVALGIALLIVWLLARMTLLSWADLSFVVPVTAVGYALAAVAGRFLLGEQVSPQRWAGALLIAAGTALVGTTAIRTTAGGES